MKIPKSIYEWAYEILDEVSDEIGEEEFDNFLLKYEGWGSFCFSQTYIDDDESCYDYAYQQTDKILDEWKNQMLNKNYIFLDGGYQEGGLYGKTWAIFYKKTNNNNMKLKNIFNA